MKHTIALLHALCVFSGFSVAAQKPNIVVIYTDDQGFGDASCYNPQSKIQTPNLDKLAAEGMRFTDGHSSDAVCTPSRYGLLTGRYSWRTTLKQGVFKAEVPGLIADGRMTLALLCREHGYATAMVGKWQLGRDGKRSVYEGGHRVPFIVRWPETVKPGGVLDGPVCQTGLLATIADILGTKLPDNAGEDSISFHGVLTGKAEGTGSLPVIHHASNGRFAIREGKWKLVMEHAQEQRELYDLAADPGEKNNVIAQHADIASRLTRRITAIVQKGRATPGADQANDTGWWDDLAWIPGQVSSPRIYKKRNKKAAQ